MLNDILEPKHIGLSVEENNCVVLEYGPFRVTVCKHTQDFPEFKNKLIEKLNEIDRDIMSSYF
jgi:hypothetical protein